jgi:hypothetical protein
VDWDNMVDLKHSVILLPNLTSFDIFGFVRITLPSFKVSFEWKREVLKPTNLTFHPLILLRVLYIKPISEGAKVKHPHEVFALTRIPTIVS